MTPRLKMKHNSHSGKSQQAQPATTGMRIRNSGEPLRFRDVQQLAGFAAETAKSGQAAKIWTRLGLTSDEPLFHRLVDSFDGVVRHMADKAGVAVNLGRTHTA